MAKDFNNSISEIINQEGNGLNVTLIDNTSDITDFYIMQELDDLEIAVDSVIDEYTIELVDAGSVVVGNYVGVQDGDRSYQGQVLSKNTNTITLDTPLDFGYTTASQIIHKSRELQVDGSVTPVVLKLGPAAGVKWLISRVILVMRLSSAGDNSKFGNITGGITNGVVLRTKGDLITNNLFNAKNNGEFTERSFDLEYVPKAGSGDDGIKIRRSFNGQDKNNAAIFLDGDNNDEFQILVQDDLTSLISFHAVIQGRNA